MGAIISAVSARRLACQPDWKLKTQAQRCAASARQWNSAMPAFHAEWDSCQRRHLINLDGWYYLNMFISGRNVSCHLGLGRTAISSTPDINTGSGAGPMLVQRRRRWTNIVPAPDRHICFADSFSNTAICSSQHIYPANIRRLTNVVLTLAHCRTRWAN